MRYISGRFTYLLTYLLTRKSGTGVFYVPVYALAFVFCIKLLLTYLLTFL